MSLRIFLSSFYTVTPSFPMDCDPSGVYPILGSKKGALWTPPMRAWRLLGRDGAGRVKRGPSVSGLGTLPGGSTTKRDGVGLRETGWESAPTSWALSGWGVPNGAALGLSAPVGGVSLKRRARGVARQALQGPAAGPHVGRPRTTPSRS